MNSRDWSDNVSRRAEARLLRNLRSRAGTCFNGRLTDGTSGALLALIVVWPASPPLATVFLPVGLTTSVWPCLRTFVDESAQGLTERSRTAPVEARGSKARAGAHPPVELRSTAGS